jgi:hypothetical protein
MPGRRFTLKRLAIVLILIAFALVLAVFHSRKINNVRESILPGARNGVAVIMTGAAVLIP